MNKGWSRFVKDKKLDAEDVVSFLRGVGELGKHHLFIDWRRQRRPDAGGPRQGCGQEVKAFRGEHGMPHIGVAEYRVLSTTSVANATMASQTPHLSSSSQQHPLQLRLYNDTPIDFLNANKGRSSLSLDFDI
ncbi:hypothetical protein HRI_005045300 [Hibiscus trionum]|uniref:TF-B3 domain-containing protein n=1 Tax=Hibiscus trionum TaxID=183268 RepID=A0A9W7JE57_HIBTR|nr:hypothetical protein HRI_005045300 [Hibiscus trionum]